jgi:hypothetical protein
VSSGLTTQEPGWFIVPLRRSLSPA